MKWCTWWAGCEVKSSKIDCKLIDERSRGIYVKWKGRVWLEDLKKGNEKGRFGYPATSNSE